LLKKAISGESFEAISKRFGVTESSLIRHLENHVSKQISAVTKQEDIVKKDISQVINESLSELEWAKQRAKEKDDIRAFTDTVKTKLNFCVRMADIRNQQAMRNGFQVTAGEYNDLRDTAIESKLDYFQIIHVIDMILSLPRGDFKSQYFVLLEHEINSGRDLDFYKSVLDSKKSIKENKPDIPAEEFFECLAQVIQDIEKDNPVYNRLKEKEDVFDLLKIFSIIETMQVNQKLLAKAQKNKLTSKDYPKILEVIKQIDAIDPGLKIFKKYVERLHKEEAK
jgi:hypothetical protein